MVLSKISAAIALQALTIELTLNGRQYVFIRQPR